MKNHKYNIDDIDIEYIVMYIWYHKWQILFISIFAIGMLPGIIRIISMAGVGVGLIFEEEKPPTPDGFYEWETSGYEGFLGRLKETILSVGEKGNSIVFIGSIYTPEEAMYVTKEEVTEFNRRVEMKHADFNAGILAKIHPAFRYRLEAYLLKDKNFIILVPSGTDITNFFKIEELQKII